MDVKQEPSDHYEEVVKTEQDVSCRKEEYYWSSAEQQQTEQSVNVGEIKQEIVECGVSEVADLPTKTEYDSIQTKQSANIGEIKQEIAHLPTKTLCDSTQFVSTTIKKELDLYIGDTKEEVGEYVQAKTESELLTTHCDLPALKSEGIDYPNYYVQPCSSKQAERTVQRLKTTGNISKNRKKTYPCLICQKNFSSSKSRLNHIYGHFGKRSATYFPSSKSRSTHIDGHFEKCYAVCQFCGRIMKQVDFFQHFFIHVVKNKVKNHIADKSLKRNISSKKLNRKNINDVDDKSFKCGTCYKTFSLKYSLRRHLKIHSGQKPFKCNICAKRFTQKSYLQQHLMIHSGQKSFKCNICAKSFTLKSYLQLHLMIHSGQKSFKCKICPKSFTHKSYLQQHLMIHSGQKSSKCNICAKSFTHKSTLRQHLLIHTGEKPFKCDICSKGFINKQHLQRHLKIHCGEKPFKCDICSKDFTQKTHGNI